MKHIMYADALLIFTKFNKNENISVDLSAAINSLSEWFRSLGLDVLRRRRSDVSYLDRELTLII